MKFALSYKSPSIIGTDLFDMELFGCYRRGGVSKLAKASASMEGEIIAKEWWRHPSIWFSGPFTRIGVRLQDLTTGELRWDAVYDVGDAPHRAEKDGEDCEVVPAGLAGLCPKERPVGGSHPFFQPDWCPGPGDSVAHKFRLTVSNLGQHGSPERPLVGEMFFTQYGPAQLANTYAYENTGPAAAA